MKKKIIYGVMILLATVYCSSVMAYSGGNGSEESPFQISSDADWQQLANKVNQERNKYKDVHFLLTCDLTITQNPKDRHMKIIGYDENHSFSGVFDGGGHKITANIAPVYNSYSNPDNSENAGIFGRIDGATIKNLSVGGKISGKPTGGICCGGSGTISNCYNSAQITSTGGAGGIAGYFEGNITNCQNSGNVSGSGSVGGICGSYSMISYQRGSDEYSNYNISYCSNSGEVQGEDAGIQGIVGGICGEVSSSNNPKGRIAISCCYNTGTVTYKGKYKASVGGIAGEFITGEGMEAEIINCYNTGAIYANGGKEVIAGGIAGYFKNANGSISNCYNGRAIVIEGTQDDVSKSIAGGICGLNGSLIKNCFALTPGFLCSTTKPVTGRVVGSNLDFKGEDIGKGKSKIENCYAWPATTINEKTRSSDDLTSNDGKDESHESLKSREWIEKNLNWDFEIWGMGDSEFPYPIIK